MRRAVGRVARGAYLITRFLLDAATALAVLFLVVLYWGTP
jgi:hypothetical protein